LYGYYENSLVSKLKSPQIFKKIALRRNYWLIICSTCYIHMQTSISRTISDSQRLGRINFSHTYQVFIHYK